MKGGGGSLNCLFFILKNGNVVLYLTNVKEERKTKKNCETI